MRRLAWLLVIAAAVWAGFEVHSKGLAGAFGGVLAGYLQPIEPVGTSPDDAEFAH